MRSPAGHVRRAFKAVLAVAGLAVVVATPADSKMRSRPGDVIQIEPVSGAPFGSSAYRILYRSTGLRGEPISVSGMVVVPGSPAPPKGRNIIAWAHPTTGVVPRCAPSLRPNIFNTIPGLGEMLARGYVVVATDYPGLGTAGPHPYLVGTSEGRAVLDSVRAARRVLGAGASNHFAVWGHSQGGHAALFTGQFARRYAPELRLVGVAAAAPAAELAALFDEDISTISGKTLTAMTLWSWSQVFGARLDRVADPDVIASIDAIANDCLDEPWRTLMVRNTPSHVPRDVPVFLAQGTADALVNPAVTMQYAASLCRRGVPVQVVSLPGVTHAFAARQSASMAVVWMADRFAAAPAPSVCTQ